MTLKKPENNWLRKGKRAKPRVAATRRRSARPAAMVPATRETRGLSTQSGLKNLIGIDGGKQTGIAVFCATTRRLLKLETKCFWTAIEFLRENFDKAETLIVVESLDSRAALYARTQAYQQKTRDCIAARVGSVRRETELLAEGLERSGFSVRRVRLHRQAKLTAKQFNRRFSWTERSNQHERDAARICFCL